MPLQQQAPHIVQHCEDCPPGAVMSILIPSWNNLSYLQTCIASIEKNSRFKHEILIHVNEGLDKTLDWVKEKGYSYSFSDTNAGVCYALNALASMAQTDYLLYMNDDMYVAPDWDYYLWQAVQSCADNRFYLSGTMVENVASGNAAVIAPFDFGNSNVEFREEAFIQWAAVNRKHDWWGSCWPPSLVHKEWWNKAGGYDVAYSPGFYSDPDFAMKLWQLGVRDFRGIGQSLIYHFRCKSTGRVIRNNGRKTFAQKWGIPSSFLYKEVLKMGQPAETGSVLKMPGGFKYLLARAKAWLIANN